LAALRISFSNFSQAFGSRSSDSISGLIGLGFRFVGLLGFVIFAAE
jgi:hypothetical protein